MTTTIRTVAEIDAEGTPYTGPAMWGTRRVFVFAGRAATACRLAHVLASTDCGWLPASDLRAVSNPLASLARELSDARVALARVRDLAAAAGATEAAEEAARALPVRVGEDS